jgi:cbb3-type cytochrome oxidase maturation protein
VGELVNSLLVLVPIALVLLGVAIWAFVWAVDHEQFDDLESEGSRILFDDDVDEHPSASRGQRTGTKAQSGSASSGSAGVAAGDDGERA